MPQFGIITHPPTTLNPRDGRLYFDPPWGLEEGQTLDATISLRFEPFQPQNTYRLIAVHITGDARLRNEVAKGTKLRAGESVEIPITWIGKHQVSVIDIRNLEAEIEVEGVVESYG